MKEQWLRHGDEIATGDSVFLFLLEDEDQAVPASRVEFDDSHPTAETKLIHPKEVVYLQPDRLLRELPAASQVARNLNALLKISRVVHAIRDLEELQAQLLDLIFEVIPAGRGAILLAEGARAGVQLSLCADAAGGAAATGAREPHDCAPGDEGQRRDSGSGRGRQRRAARRGKPGGLRGALAVVRAADRVSASDWVHLPGQHQCGQPVSGGSPATAWRRSPGFPRWRWTTRGGCNGWSRKTSG